MLLPFDVGEIGDPRGGEIGLIQQRSIPPNRRDEVHTVKMLHQLPQRYHRDHVNVRHKCGLQRIFCRHIDRLIARLRRGVGHRHHPLHVTYRPIQRKLTDEYGFLQRRQRRLIGSRQHADGDR